MMSISWNGLSRDVHLLQRSWNWSMKLNTSWAKKTPSLKYVVPSQSFAIFYLFVVFTSKLHRCSTGSVPTSQINQNANFWFLVESAAFYVRTFYRRKLHLWGIFLCNPGDTVLNGLVQNLTVFFSQVLLVLFMKWMVNSFTFTVKVMKFFNKWFITFGKSP